MSAIEIIPVTTPSQKRDFLRLPERLYAGDPYWVCPLRIERRDFFDPKKNPFFDNADVQLFLARREGRWVGRISAHVYHPHNRTHNERTGFFGFFDCENDYPIAEALWNTARNWLSEHGMDRMRGPANFTTNHEVGFLVDGFDQPPVIMMTYNPRSYPEFAEHYGLQKVMDLYAYHGRTADGFDPRVGRVVDHIRERSGVTTRTMDMKHFDDEVARVKAIYDAAWAPNWGFVPMSDAEFAHMAKDLKPVVDPQMVIFADAGGRTVGFSLALPDLNQVLILLKGCLLPFGLFRLLWHLKVRRSINAARVLVMGITPEYQKRGIDNILHCRSLLTQRLQALLLGLAYDVYRLKHAVPCASA
ncbi:MAG: N-acetyltransferase [candidate division Zixibacteria bacterium]|nr:N-acetyltransferase [candidate division Zixibacteria bacterium]